MRAAPGSLEFAHHIRVIRVLLNNSATGNTPGIGAGSSQRTSRFIPSKKIVQGNGRLTRSRASKPRITCLIAFWPPSGA